MMNVPVFLLILTSLTAFAAPAHASSFCSDLWKRSKFPIEIKDPTGAATNLKDSSFEKGFNEVFGDLPRRLTERYSDLLSQKNPDEDLVKQLLDFDFSTWPACAGVHAELLRDTRIPKPCVVMMAQFLADNTHQRLTREYLDHFSSTPELDTLAPATVPDVGLKNIIENAVVIKVGRAVLERLEKTLVTSTISQKIRDEKNGTFVRVMSIIEAKVRRDFQPKAGDSSAQAEETLRVRDNFLARLRTVSFGAFDCSKVSKVNLSNALSFNFYLTDKNEILFCPGSLRRNHSEYSWVWFLAHEIAHVLGPCHLGALPLREDLQFSYQGVASRESKLAIHPYGKVLQCLSHPKAAGAYETPGAPAEWTPFCSSREQKNEEWGDQIDETFSDWIATETLNDYMRVFYQKHSVEEKRSGLLNVFRGIDAFVWNGSSDTDASTMSSSAYLSIQDRLNRVLFAHPGIRDQVGCGSENYPVTYCH